MIELLPRHLVFSFPEVVPNAELRISFERTLRIPDDGHDYPLPPSLGHFPLRHTDDCRVHLAAKDIDRGGVVLPMYQREALWLRFESHGADYRTLCYPFAVQIAAGKIDAVSGKAWKPDLDRAPQNYVVAPHQPWLDGFHVGKGVIRQFVAMPLGAGYSVEEQLTGEAEFGGLQIAVRPLRPEAFERRNRSATRLDIPFFSRTLGESPAETLGLGAGGRMQQKIGKDSFELEDWDHDNVSRCFVHLVDARAWPTITGEPAPKTPIDAVAYAKAGLPWFEYDSPEPEIEGSPILAKVKSISTIEREQGKPATEATIPLLRSHRVRESNW